MRTNDGNFHLTETALELINSLSRNNLKTANDLLDQLLFYRWSKQFSGASDDAVKEHLKDHKTVLKLSSVVADASLLQLNEIILEARLAIWMNTYSSIPNSLLSKRMASFQRQHLSEVDIQ